MNPATRQFLRKRMTEEYRAELSRILADWRGTSVLLKSYEGHLEGLSLELSREGVLGCLRILCQGCTHLSGPTSWKDAALAVEALSEGADAGRFRLVDARASFSATCDQVSARNDSEDPRLMERPEFQAFLASLPGGRFIRLAEEIHPGIYPKAAYSRIRGLLDVPYSDLEYVDPREEPEPFLRWLREHTKGIDFSLGCSLWADALARQVGGTPWLKVELECGLDSLLPLWTRLHSIVTLVFCPASGDVFGVFNDEDRWCLFRQPWRGVP
ncbi:hypothetical protein [Pyxidicoccus caerfyrddinensis]|uniref:hypothetical protein n=1 Tax=Pyxidicoccus caerfyrddinensis TaxID=2709663 RepID=UPI0013DAFF00|nr:hypothetical protein [Pyxidicoccus caerfyrddinensis]